MRPSPNKPLHLRAMLCSIMFMATFAFVGCSSLPTRSLSVDQRAALEVEVDAYLKEWGETFAAKDLDKMVALYAPDADLVYDDDKEIRGAGEIRRHFEGEFRAEAESEEVFTEVRRRFVSSELVIESARWERKGNRDLTKPTHGRYSATLQKIDGVWKIIHDRAWSTAPPDSGKND